jgi:hypothetical protein
MIPLPMNFYDKTEPVLPHLKDKTIVHVEAPMEMAILEGGMVSGSPSVMLAVPMPDGTVAIAQTSAKLFCTAARAIQAKYPTVLD